MSILHLIELVSKPLANSAFQSSPWRCCMTVEMHMHGRSQRAGAIQMHTYYLETTQQRRRWLACDRLPLLSFPPTSHMLSVHLVQFIIHYAFCYRLHEISNKHASRNRWRYSGQRRPVEERLISGVNCASGQLVCGERHSRPEEEALLPLCGRVVGRLTFTPSI